jgi:hypothetical protein
MNNNHDDDYNNKGIRSGIVRKTAFIFKEIRTRKTDDIKKIDQHSYIDIG